MDVSLTQAKLETKALKAKRPGFTDERYNETSYYHEPENGLRKVYPYYFTFTTFTKVRRDSPAPHGLFLEVGQHPS